MHTLLAISDFIWGTLLFYSLIPIAVYFSIRMGFPQIRYFFRMFKMMLEKGHEGDTKDVISAFQALMVSTSARVGTGNVAGVAMAIYFGGPGAVFWMWVMALFGMATAIVENSLGQLYKERDVHNNYIGGPAYYIKKYFDSTAGNVLSLLFVLSIILCFGFAITGVQANTIAQSLENSFKIPTYITGIFIAVSIFLIAVGGIKRVAFVTQILVPFMIIIYFLFAFGVFVTHPASFFEALKSIVKGAFGAQQVLSGAAGYSLAQAFTLGIKRGLFSNEAGLGSSPNAAATASVGHPVSQGFIQAFGVFIDTIIVCSITAFVVIMSGVGTEGLLGVQYTQAAFDHYLRGGGTFVSFCVFLFAYTSIIGNYYYAEANLKFLSQNKILLIIFQIAFAVLTYFGATIAQSKAWDLGDLFMGIMAIINLLAILLMSEKAIALFRDYDSKAKKGILQPKFKVSDLKGDNKNITEW